MKRALILALAMSPLLSPSLPAQNDLLAENAALQYWQAFAVMPEKLSKEEDDLVYGLDDAPSLTSETAKSLIRRSEQALRYLHRGAKVRKCHWGFTQDDGIDALLRPHWQKARQLANLALLRARYHFEQNQAAAAWEDVISTMTLARHMAAEPMSISILSGQALEEMAILVICQHSVQGRPEVLRAWARQFDGLPGPARFVEAFQMEKELHLRMFAKSIKNDPHSAYTYAAITLRMRRAGEETLHASKSFKPFLLLHEAVVDRLGLKQTVEEQTDREVARAVSKLFLEPEGLDPVIQAAGRLWDEAAEIVKVPMDQVDNAYTKYRKKVDAASVLARALAPDSVDKLRRAEARGELRRAMFKAALAVAADGPDRLKHFKDPFGDGPFEYRKTQGGFELRSKLKDHKGEPVKLVVGKQ